MTGYAERYMGRPAENPEGYKRSSPKTNAGEMKARLMIPHIEDANVHFQNGSAAISSSQQWNSQYPVVPLFGIGSAPNQHEFFDGFAYGQILWHQQHARTGAADLKEVAKMPRHCLKIVRDENAVLFGRQRKHLEIGKPFQLRNVG